MSLDRGQADHGILVEKEEEEEEEYSYWNLFLKLYFIKIIIYK